MPAVFAQLLCCCQLVLSWCQGQSDTPCHAMLLLQVLLSATEAAEMILRVDDIIRCAPRPRQG